jgi:hypothetical protein
MATTLGNLIVGTYHGKIGLHDMIGHVILLTFAKKNVKGGNKNITSPILKKRS